MGKARNLSKLSSVLTTDGAVPVAKGGTGTTSGATSGGSSPTITAIGYPGDDTAVNTSGGNTVTLTGTNFAVGVNVVVNGVSASVVTRVSSTQLTFTTTAQSAGSYIIYVVNTDGSTALAVPGLQYSGVPNWTTSAGSLGSPGTNVSFSTTIAATGDAPVTYSVYSGSLPSGITLNSSTGVISGTTPVVGSSTTYNFTIRATDAQKQDTDRAFSISIVPVVVGQQAYTTPGTYTWTAPAGVTSVSVVCVGGGGGCYFNQMSGYYYIVGGGGGALAYTNNFSVTPGNTYQVVVGVAGGFTESTAGSDQTLGDGGFSSFNSTVCKAGGGFRPLANSTTGGLGGTVLYGTGGGSGGPGGTGVNSAHKRSGGGGAGGYTGTGGAGGPPLTTGASGTGGAAGGGGGDDVFGTVGPGGGAGAGGGTGIFGQGASGGGGTITGQGSGGSGGTAGATVETGRGGNYGGGGAYGGTGAVRIIWPGNTRQFPSTGTADQ